jgi:uncharacterized protein with HEPN domain
MSEECSYLVHIGSQVSIGDIIHDPTLQRAVVRSIEVLGEASKNLSPALKQQNPEIPWEDIAGIRDILAHRYFGVDWDVVSDVIFNEIPNLDVQIKSILAEMDE